MLDFQIKLKFNFQAEKNFSPGRETSFFENSIAVKIAST
jgi:hypothetical protein